MTGKVVFAEVIAAALSIDGSQYYNKCWRHAAGHVVSPPLRDDQLTGDYLLDLLSKSVTHSLTQSCRVHVLSFLGSDVNKARTLKAKAN